MATIPVYAHGHSEFGPGGEVEWEWGGGGGGSRGESQAFIGGFDYHGAAAERERGAEGLGATEGFIRGLGGTAGVD